MSERWAQPDARDMEPAKMGPRKNALSFSRGEEGRRNERALGAAGREGYGACPDEVHIIFTEGSQTVQHFPRRAWYDKRVRCKTRQSPPSLFSLK